MMNTERDEEAAPSEYIAKNVTGPVYLFMEMFLIPFTERVAKQREMASWVEQ
jgi:hypothetical protein